MKVPLGIKIIAVLQILNAVRLLLASLLLFGGVYGMPAFGLGVIVLLSSLIFGFLGVSLWQLKPWARILNIIISVIVLFLSLFQIITNNVLGGVGGFVFSLIVAIYLGFSEKVKKSFH